jgi:hypothetical protein
MGVRSKGKMPRTVFATATAPPPTHNQVGTAFKVLITFCRETPRSSDLDLDLDLNLEVDVDPANTYSQI